jgi:hypothetical protein
MSDIETQALETASRRASCAGHSVGRNASKGEQDLDSVSGSLQLTRTLQLADAHSRPGILTWLGMAAHSCTGHLGKLLNDIELN